MKMHGSWSRLVSLLFRKDGQDVTLKPNQATTYSAARSVELPAGDVDAVLVSQAGADAAYQPLDDELTALAGLSSNGVIVKTGAGTAAVRSVAAGSAISVADGDGVSGNPTVAVDVAAATALNEAPALTDELLIADASASNAVKKITVSELAQAIGPDAYGFAADWDSGDGTSKAITHSLNSLDVMVQIYDKADGSTVYVDSVLRDTVDSIALTSSEAPGASGWRVLVQKIA